MKEGGIHNASQLRALRASGQDCGAFINSLNDKLGAMLLPTLAGSTRSVVERMISLGHQLSIDSGVTSHENMRVEYQCTLPRVPGEISRLVFQLNACVLSVAEGTGVLPRPSADDGGPLQEDVSPAALAANHSAGSKPRAVERRVEIIAEHLWLQELKNPWQQFFHRLESAGYNLVEVFLDENSLDLRDVELSIHVGMSAIVAAVLDEDTLEA